MASRFKLFIPCLLFAFASCKKSSSNKPLVSGNKLSLSALELQKSVTDNSFTFKLFNNLAAGNTSDNLLISPLSVSIAMAMTSNGAAGQTLAAIDSAMNFNGYTQAELNTYYNKLITQLPILDPNTTLNIANSIWYKQGFDVLSPFISTNSSYYNAQISALNFTAPSSVTTINNWVNDHTNGKIPGIINSIPANQVMYLINALYFKSTWQEKFDPSKTQPLPFYVAAGNPVQAQFMTGTVDINSYYDANVTVFELPYSGKTYSMVIVVPQGNKTPADVMQSLSQTQWQTWMNALTPTQQQVWLPKFAYSYGTSLNNALTAMGMGVAFTDEANFSKISPQNLQISQVEHKAYIAVDESGTEAAAVTAVGVIATVEPEIKPDYNVNKPFIFAIRERSSGLVVFAGLINNPLLTGSN